MEQILHRFPDLVNTRAINGMSCLMFAVGFGHLDLVKLLIKEGAEIEVSGTRQISPLDVLKLGTVNTYPIMEYLLRVFGERRI